MAIINSSALSALGMKVREGISGSYEITAPGGTTATVNAKQLKDLGEKLGQLIGKVGSNVKGYAAQLMGNAKDVRLARAENFGNVVCDLAKTLGMPFVADILGAQCKPSIAQLEGNRSLQQGGK
jgi:hypothetical protein